MSYDFKKERARLLTTEGLDLVVDILQKIQRMCAHSGAVSMGRLLIGDSWLCLAAVDYLIERGVIEEVTQADVAGQNRVFVMRSAP